MPTQTRKNGGGKNNDKKAPKKTYSNVISGKKALNVTAKEFYPVSEAPASAASASAASANTAFLSATANEALASNMMRLSLANHYKRMYENAVAIDCEMVGVGAKSVLAHVAIVDFNGNQIYNTYVIPKMGLGSITDYRTKYSGITRKKLEAFNNPEHSFDNIKKEVHSILQYKIIVGHGLVNDFLALEYYPYTNQVWDTANHPSYMKIGPSGVLQPKKLKELAKDFAGNNIQKADREGHSPLEDARASMNLYRLAMGYPKLIYANMSK